LSQKATPLLAFQSTPLPSETDENLHRLRIAVKKFRYVLEIYNPLHDQRFDQAIQAAKELQDLLGKIHDHAVLLSQLQAHKDHLHERNHLSLMAGCEKVIQFFKERRQSLCPLLEASYSATTRELAPILAPKAPLRFALTRRRKSTKSRDTTIAALIKGGADKVGELQQARLKDSRRSDGR
jgi:CHAD domain